MTGQEVEGLKQAIRDAMTKQSQDLEEIMKGANPEAQVAVSTILVFLFSNIRSG